MRSRKKYVKKNCSSFWNIYYINHKYYFHFKDPSGFPEETSNSTKDERGQILIQWQDIKPMLKRGIVTHYKIEYTKINHTWDTVDALPMIQLVTLEEENEPGSPSTRTRRKAPQYMPPSLPQPQPPSLPQPQPPNPPSSNINQMTQVQVENKTIKSDGSIWYSSRLTNLENFTDYKIRLAGKTHAGFGPFSQYVIYQTPEYGEYNQSLSLYPQNQI